MRHDEINQGVLRAYLDREFDADQLAEIERHVDECSACSEELATVRNQAARVHDAFERLPEFAREDNTAAAWAGFQKRREERTARWQGWWTLGRGLSFAGASLGIAAVLLVITVAPLRAWAENLLAIFRVERFTVLEINPADLKGNGLQNNQILNQNIGRLLSDEMTVTQNPQKPQPVADPQTAARLAGFSVQLLPGQTPSRLLVESGAGMNLKLDRDRIQSILDEAGHGDLQIPASVDGATIGVRVPPGVMAFYGDCGEMKAQVAAAGAGARPGQDAAAPCVSLFELPSPTVSAPQEINPAEIAQIALQLLGMSPKDAASFTQTVNWSSTFVLPIVRGESNYERVQIHGNEGALLRPANQSSSGHFTLMWVDNGIVFALNGAGDDTLAINLASQVQ